MTDHDTNLEETLAQIQAWRAAEAEGREAGPSQVALTKERSTEVIAATKKVLGSKLADCLTAGEYAALDLALAGESLRKIAKEIGVAKSHVPRLAAGATEKLERAARVALRDGKLPPELEAACTAILPESEQQPDREAEDFRAETGRWKREAHEPSTGWGSDG